MTAVLPYMYVCTMYILLSRLLYSPTCMCVQCTYFYHDCCTPLHACVYNVHTSITTGVLLYMHVCTMYILLSRLLYSLGPRPTLACSTECMFLILNSIVVTAQLCSWLAVQRRGYHNTINTHAIQNKLTVRSVPDPLVRAGDEKRTSSAARWVWAQD